MESGQGGWGSAIQQPDTPVYSINCRLSAYPVRGHAGPETCQSVARPVHMRYGQFRDVSLPACLLLDCGRKPESPEATVQQGLSACKLHTHRAEAGFEPTALSPALQGQDIIQTFSF